MSKLNFLLKFGEKYMVLPFDEASVNLIAVLKSQQYARDYDYIKHQYVYTPTTSDITVTVISEEEIKFNTEKH